MSTRVPAASSRPYLHVAAALLALLLQPFPTALAATAPEVSPGAPAAHPSDARTPAGFEALIVRVFVNTVVKGDVAVLRDSRGHILVPAGDFARWGLALAPSEAVVVDAERYVDLAALPDLTVRFDLATITLDVRVAAKAFPGASLDLAPQRRPNVSYPADNSVFLNYGFNASGDESFADRRYQFTTELGARAGNWLFYNTTNQQWGNDGSSDGFTRLMTNVQYDDRVNLRRLTIGDFFTPSFDLSGSVPLGGVSLTKYYSMDPYFIQYPTASFRTEVSLPSTVLVRVDGNLIAQRQVQPGPLDITNITGVTGGQNVSVVIRDAFGREQVLQQPFFFATNAGLAKGLHEYSYNLGLLRRDYGSASDDYGSLAASAFHRYAFTDALTLGLRGQATRDLFNLGPFGTWQFPRFGLLGLGVSVGGSDSRVGPAASAAYSYTGGNVSLNVGTRYLSRDYAQLSDLVSPFRTRQDQYASGSIYEPSIGTLGVTYTSTTRYDASATTIWNATYTRALLAGKALLSLTYSRTYEPLSAYAWQLSLRYFFDSETSLAAGVGGIRRGNTQTVTLDRTAPQGEGLGYSFTAGHVGGNDSDAAFGQALVQLNAAHLTVGASYSRASRPEGGPSLSQAFVAGSVGIVDGSPFAARPVLDSFALVRIPGMRDVPVYSNGWYAGRTDANGEVVATNIASYYDNIITFSSRQMPLDYIFSSSEQVISPPTRSGTLVEFGVRRNLAIQGTLVEMRDGRSVPLEFREITLRRNGERIAAFSARRGEFYVDGVTPGDYELVVEGVPPCSVRITMPDQAEAMASVGTVVCKPFAR